MTPDQFTTYAAGITYNPRNQNAKGLLAPLIRSMGHILFLLATEAHESNNPTDPPNPILSPEEKQNELDAARDHIPLLDEILDSPALSANAKVNIVAYATIIDHLKTDWASWPPADRLSTLRAATNAAAALGAFLDRELVGFRSAQSDPGISL